MIWNLFGSCVCDLRFFIWFLDLVIFKLTVYE